MKKVKIVTIILAIIAITMVAVLGVYIPVQNRMENKVKKYSYAMDIEGSRTIRLRVSTGTTTTIKDAEGKVVEDTEELTDEQLAEKGYVKEVIPYNSEDVKNVENYRASQKIIEKRLEKLGVDNYIIKLDEENGDILIELTENDATDKIISNLNTTGKYEIVDSETKEVLLDNSYIKSAAVMYGSSNSTSNAGTQVYLDIEFNEEGAKKLEEITSTYVKKEEENSEDETTDETTSETTDETTAEADSTEEEKTITMNIDDEEIMTTSFDEPIKTGGLQLSVGTASTDAKTLQDYITRASSMATVLDVGKMPVKYDLNENEFVFSDIEHNEIQIAKYVALGIVAVALIVLIIKYKSTGILAAFSYVGCLSILILILRYANVVLSLEGLFGIGVVLVLNYILVNQLLKKEKIGTTYKEFFIKIIPIIILVITFCFIKWTPISSFGMVMFWGIALIAAYNGIVTNSLLKIKEGRENRNERN